jgi:hypothetical protein
MQWTERENEDVGSQLPKWRLVLQSRKVWAGLLALGLTLGLWHLGELEGAEVVEAMTWVVGIFMGAVALEDGLRGLLDGKPWGR